MIDIKGEQLKLIDLKIFSDEQLKTLRDYNILTAEQLVGLCATKEGFNGIMLVLRINKNKLNKILYEVKNHLPPELAEILSKPSTFLPPLGARKPRKKEKTKKTKRC